MDSEQDVAADSAGRAEVHADATPEGDASPPPRSGAVARKSSTRDLLVAGAFGAIGAVILVAVAPLTTALAATFPPGYAVVAGIHSVLPYTARRLLALPFAATLVAAVVGLLSFASTALGPLILISLLAATLPYDLVLRIASRGSRTPRTWQHLLAAATAGVVLFVVSLPVFSPEHLTPVMVVTVLIGRVVGQCAAVGVATLLASAVQRAGIRRRPTRD